MTFFRARLGNGKPFVKIVLRTKIDDSEAKLTNGLHVNGIGIPAYILHVFLVSVYIIARSTIKIKVNQSLAKFGTVCNSQDLAKCEGMAPFAAPRPYVKASKLFIF